MTAGTYSTEVMPEKNSHVPELITKGRLFYMSTLDIKNTPESNWHVEIRKGKPHILTLGRHIIQLYGLKPRLEVIPSNTRASVETAKITSEILTNEYKVQTKITGVNEKEDLYLSDRYLDNWTARSIADKAYSSGGAILYIAGLDAIIKFIPNEAFMPNHCQAGEILNSQLLPVTNGYPPR